jgi:hypothetical protein
MKERPYMVVWEPFGSAVYAKNEVEKMEGKSIFQAKEMISVESS